jgi:hypothetical protein
VCAGRLASAQPASNRVQPSTPASQVRLIINPRYALRAAFARRGAAVRREIINRTDYNRQMLTVVLLASMLMSSSAAEPEIRAVDGQVTIRAQSIPLQRILDRLSSATGMEVRYEGTRPTNRVTVDVDGLSEAEAVPRLMEGLGLSYVLRTDSTGRRVEVLFVSGSGARAASAAPTGSGARQQVSPVLEYEGPAESELIPVDPAALENAAGRSEPIDLGTPQFTQPGPPPPNAGPINPMRPSGVGMRDMPQPPVFPQGVSFPRQ